MLCPGSAWWVLSTQPSTDIAAASLLTETSRVPMTWLVSVQGKVSAAHQAEISVCQPQGDELGFKASIGGQVLFPIF